MTHLHRLCLSLALLWPVAVRAQEALPIEQRASAGREWAADTWLGDPDGMTGNWGGFRDRLKNDGITTYGAFLVELAAAVDGGRSRGGAYAHQLNVGARLDLGRVAGMKGATAVVEFAYRDGENLSATRVGNLFEVQETFGGGRIARLAELSIEQSIANDAVNIKVGRIFAGADFAFSSLTCEFQSNAFCGHPNSIPYNSGISLYPVASWGVRLQFKPVHGLYVRTGAFEVNYSLNNKNGFDWSTRDATGVFVPVEIGLTTGTARYQGLVRVGGYYDSSHTPDSYRDVAGGSQAVSGLPAQMRRGRWGLYAMVEHKVFAPSVDPARGLSVFGAVTLSDRDTAYFRSFVELGAVYTGPLRSRPHDTASLGVAYGGVSGARIAYQRDQALRTRGIQLQSNEIIIEANYNLKLGPWFSIRPNIQYVLRPGALASNRDATVLGLQTVINF